MYDIERIHLATCVNDALQALEQDSKAVVICGGSDVLIQIREGKLAGCSLVSIQGLAELQGIRMEEDGTVVIGPGNTFAQVTESSIIQAHMPWLAYATDQAGGPQLRNIGTIGGNICNGVTSADSASSLLTLNAQLEITSSKGKRTVAHEAFYAGPGRVHLEHGELLTAIRIHKADYESFGGCYLKYAQRNAMDIATIGCAAAVKLTADKKSIGEYRLAFGVAAPTPMRCHGVEAKLAGQAVTPEMLASIGEAALSELSPRNSWRASKAFREQLIRELTRRATTQAIQNAGGDVS